MTVKSCQHLLRCYTILTPVALLGIGFTAAHAVDHVVAVGQTHTGGFSLANGDSLTNSGTISHTGGIAVGYFSPPGGVAFVLNTETGTISATGTGLGVYIDGSLGLLENGGLISAEQRPAVGVEGSLGNFRNTGTISSVNNPALWVNGSAGQLINAGTIIGGDDGSGISVAGDVDSFVNESSGTIATGKWNGVQINGTVGQFSNAGSIAGGSDGHGVRIDGSVGSFVNESSGTIAAGKSNGVDIGGPVGQFSNAGTITGGPNGQAVYIDQSVESFANLTSGSLVSAWGNGLEINGPVGQFNNAGRIVGGADGNGVRIHGHIGSFVNESSGTIIAAQWNGVEVSAPLDQFSNAGTIVGGVDGQAVRIDGPVGTFTNMATGTIKTTTDHQTVRIRAPVTSFVNAGRIESLAHKGVDIDGRVGSFTNTGRIETWNDSLHFRDGVGVLSNSGRIVASRDGQFGIYVEGANDSQLTNTGTIEGWRAIVLDNGGDHVVVNSGTLHGRSGEAVIFDGGDDLFVIQTGSRVHGDVDMQGGTDTFDLRNFAGNQLINVYNVENVLVGDQLLVRDGDTFAIIEQTGITAAVPLASAAAAFALGGIVDAQLAAGPAGAPDDAVEPLGYMPVAAPTAAGAAIAGATAQPNNGVTLWGTTALGGASRAAGVPLGNIYGAVVAGGHAAVSGNATLGLLGGYLGSRTDVNNGGQVVTGSTGIAGIYGRVGLGVVNVDATLIAGLSGNDSVRSVAGPTGPEEARAQFASWFVSPQLGIEIPLLETAESKLSIDGSIGYVGGAANGYTETGSSMNLVVGSQAIGVFDARIGLEGVMFAGQDRASDVTLTARGGLFVQADTGTGAVPVTVLGQTVNAQAGGGTSHGVYGGLGLAADLGTVRFETRADAQWRNDGLLSGVVKMGISSRL